MNSSATSLRRAWPYDEAMAGRRPSSRTQPAVGKRLALARQRKGITQAELAELLGVSQSLVAHYETRATNPQRAWHIAQNPGILVALSPHHAVNYFVEHGLPPWVIITIAVVIELS